MRHCFLLILIAVIGGVHNSHAQVAADPVLWANLGSGKSRGYGLRTLDIRASYFGEFLGPNVGRIDDNLYDQEGNKTRDPILMYHNFNFNTQLTESARLLVSPRFITPFGDKKDLRETDDHGSLMMDDWVLGITYNWHRSEKWVHDTRLSERLPTSTASKNNHVDGQTELRQSLSYRPRPELSVTTQSTIRYYHYDTEATEERYRLNQTSFVNYVHTDKWNTQLMHEYEQQHRAPKEGRGQRAWNHTTTNRNQLAMGLGHNFTRDLNLMPFLKALDVENIHPETIQAGLWVSANVF